MVFALVCVCPSAGVRAAGSVAPQLTQVDLVTARASSVPSANAWGANADRMVRARNGDLYTVYVASGSDSEHFRWVLSKRSARRGTWRTVTSGPTAHQPGNPPAVLIGPTGTVFVVTISPWNSAAGGRPEIWSSASRRTTVVKGHWLTGRAMVPAGALYPAAAIDGRGDIYIWENVICTDFRYANGRRARCKNVDVPGTVYWGYRRANSRAWHSERWISKSRYAYDFLLPQGNNALTMVGTRDILQAPYEAPYACPGRDHYCLDQTVEARWAHLDGGPSSLIVAHAARGAPGYRGDHRASAEDAYVDVLGSTHVLVTVADATTGGRFANHELVIDPDGHVTDTLYYAVPYPNLSRIVQDSSGGFWVYSVGPSLTQKRRCDVYIASAGAANTEGTQFGPTAVLPFPAGFDCTSETRNYDVSPRSGSAPANYIDGVVATNGGSDWVSYRIALP